MAKVTFRILQSEIDSMVRGHVRSVLGEGVEIIRYNDVDDGVELCVGVPERSPESAVVVNSMSLLTPQAIETIFSSEQAHQAVKSAIRPHAPEDVETEPDAGPQLESQEIRGEGFDADNFKIIDDPPSPIVESVMVPCSDCGGTGIFVDVECRECDGGGEVLA